MKKNICATKVRKEIRQGLLIGPVSLAAGLLILYFGDYFSGPILEVLDNLGKNFVFICVSLLLILCGAYLFFHSLKGLIRLESTDVCKAIHSQLRPEEENLTGKEMIAMADKDLAYAQKYAGGKVLIGCEWLVVPKSMGQFMIRLENIRHIERRGKDSAGLYLKFNDQSGRGPVTGELTPVEANLIESYVQGYIADLKN